MKKFTLTGTVLLLCLHVFGQVPIHEFFPMGVCGIALGDTLLNTRSVVKQERIRTITSYQDKTGSAKTVTRIIQRLNRYGAIEEMFSCIKSSKDDPGTCSSDTVLYDPWGRTSEIRFRTGAGYPYLRTLMAYEGKDKIKETVIQGAPQGTFDTTTRYRLYNDKFQLARIEYEEDKPVPRNASLFYNSDGMLDSIRYDDPSRSTQIFKRSQTGKKKQNKQIQLEVSNRVYTWIYNQNGQCISSHWTLKNASIVSSSQASYEYNRNGTLSKVVEKINGKTYCTTMYEYEK